MKGTMLANRLVLGLILTAAAVGCQGTKYGVTKLPDPQNSGKASDVTGAPPVNSGADNPEGTPYPISDPEKRKDWPRDAKVFETDTTHFDYDSSVIKPTDKPKVVLVADYLKANASDALEIDGHADERGTEEYNRALGERRALALREELIRLGIDPSRVDTVTYGKDRPVDTGHDESAHKKNRRGEFLLETPPAK